MGQEFGGHEVRTVSDSSCQENFPPEKGHSVYLSWVARRGARSHQRAICGRKTGRTTVRALKAWPRRGGREGVLPSIHDRLFRNLERLYVCAIPPGRNWPPHAPDGAREMILVLEATGLDQRVERRGASFFFF